MYCTNCGEEISETATYCPECGSRQGSTDETQPEEPSTGTDESFRYQIPGIARENTTRRNALTGIGYSISGLFLVGLIGNSDTEDSGSSGGNSSTEENYPNAWAYDEGTEIVLDNVEGQVGNFSSTITGEATNDSSQDYNYVQLGFGLYDGSGAKVGDALANTSGLSAGQTWRFEAMGTETESVASFDLEDVTAY